MRSLLGSNVPLSGGLARAAAVGGEWGCEAIQVYTGPSRQWALPPLTPQEIADFKKSRSNSGIGAVLAHVPFLVNLASTAPSHWEKSIDRLADELSRAGALGIEYVVLHPGSSPRPRSENCRRIAEGIRRAHGKAEAPCKLLLENMAGQGRTTGSLSELATIMEAVRDVEVGVCIDTCHLFAGGLDFRGELGLSRLVSNIDATVGRDQVKALHLNDSQGPLGSHLDRHCAPGTGAIGIHTFHLLLHHPLFQNLPMVLEVPDRDTETLRSLELLRHLRSSPPGRELTPAFQSLLQEFAHVPD